MEDAYQEHQDASLAELGEALARLRDELTWTTHLLRTTQAEAAEATRRAEAAELRLAQVEESTTWRVGRAVVRPLARLRAR